MICKACAATKHEECANVRLGKKKRAITATTWCDCAHRMAPAKLPLPAEDC